MNMVDGELLMKAIEQAIANVCLEEDIIIEENDKEAIKKKVLVMEKNRNG